MTFTPPDGWTDARHPNIPVPARAKRWRWTGPNGIDATIDLAGSTVMRIHCHSLRGERLHVSEVAPALAAIAEFCAALAKAGA